MKRMLFVCLCLFLADCGSGGGGGLTGSYKVTDVHILANDIDLGEEVRVDVFFDTKVESFGEPDGLDVVAELDPQLEYVLGSSAIYDRSTDDTDTRTPDDVLKCPDGRTFVAYFLSDSELEGRSLSGTESFGLRFHVRGKTPAPAARVRASAAHDQEFSCDSVFQGEKEESVKVK